MFDTYPATTPLANDASDVYPPMPGMPVIPPRRPRSVGDTLPRGSITAFDPNSPESRALRATLFRQSGGAAEVPMSALGETRGGFTSPAAISSMVAQGGGADEQPLPGPGAGAAARDQATPLAAGQSMPIGVARAAPPGDQVIGVARSGPVVSRPGEMPAPGGGLPLGIGKNIHRADLRNGEETEWPVVGNAARLPGQQMMPSAGVLGSPKMEELTTDYLKSLPPKPGAAPVPIPGMSNIGNAAQGDTQAHAAWLQEQMARLMPKASPMENYLRNSSPPISISYGNYGPGRNAAGRRLPELPRALSQAGSGGAGSSGVGCHELLDQRPGERPGSRRAQ